LSRDRKFANRGLLRLLYEGMQGNKRFVMKSEDDTGLASARQ
jgi:hypothetical protein